MDVNAEELVLFEKPVAVHEELVERFGSIANLQLRIAVAKAAAVAKSDRHLVVVAAAVAVLVQPRRLDAYERLDRIGKDHAAAACRRRSRVHDGRTAR